MVVVNDNHPQLFLNQRPRQHAAGQSLADNNEIRFHEKMD
jgi:hypothetical protein